MYDKENIQIAKMFSSPENWEYIPLIVVTWKAQLVRELRQWFPTVSMTFEQIKLSTFVFFCQERFSNEGADRPINHGPFQSGLTLVCAIYLRYLLYIFSLIAK